jgi:hypothetical protein
MALWVIEIESMGGFVGLTKTASAILVLGPNFYLETLRPSDRRPLISPPTLHSSLTARGIQSFLHVVVNYCQAFGQLLARSNLFHFDWDLMHIEIIGSSPKYKNETVRFNICRYVAGN